MSGEVYQPDTRVYTGLPDIDYSLPDQTDIVSRCGRICLGRRKLISVRFLLVKLLVSRRSKKVFGWSALRNDDLGYIDLEEKTLQPLQNPFGFQSPRCWDTHRPRSFLGTRRF
jgi:hypothetical protein